MNRAAIHVQIRFGHSANSSNWLSEFECCYLSSTVHGAQIAEMQLCYHAFTITIKEQLLLAMVTSLTIQAAHLHFH